MCVCVCVCVSGRESEPGSFTFLLFSDAFAIATAAAKTDIGQISEPVPTADGALLVHVAKKELPKDPKMEDDKKAIALRQAMTASQTPESNPLFSAWFNKKRDQADASLSVQ